MKYESEGPRQRGRPKRTWEEVVEKDCQARKLNKEDAVDCSRSINQYRMSDDQDGREWVNVSSGIGHLGSSRQRAIKWLCVCMCVDTKVTSQVRRQISWGAAKEKKPNTTKKEYKTK